MKTPPLQVLRYLLLFTAAVLVVFGFSSFIGISRDSNRLVLYALYALLMFGDAAAVLICVFQLHRKKKQIFGLAAICLALNIVLSIFDQFSFINLLFLLLNLITLIILFVIRKEINPA